MIPTILPTPEDAAIMVRGDMKSTISRGRMMDGDSRDLFLFTCLAHEQAYSEVDRSERMRAYAFLGGI